MKQLYIPKDIFILLVSLLIFSFGISFLYGNLGVMPEPPEPVVLEKNATSANLAIHRNDIHTIILPFIMAHDTIKMSDVIARFLSLEKQKLLIEKLILDKKTDLSAIDKIKLVLNMSLRQKNPLEAVQFFSLFTQYPHLLKGPPVLYIAAKDGLQNSVPLLLQWLEKENSLKEKWIIQAFRYAIFHREPTVLQLLLDKGIALTGIQVTDLLWYAILQKTDSAIILTLKKAGADINSERKGKTPLISATELDQLPIVRVLLENGALVNDIKDPAVGSALQTAVRKGYTPIELILRKNGARE